MVTWLNVWGGVIGREEGNTEKQYITTSDVMLSVFTIARAFFSPSRKNAKTQHTTTQPFTHLFSHAPSRRNDIQLLNYNTEEGGVEEKQERIAGQIEQEGVMDVS